MKRNSPRKRSEHIDKVIGANCKTIRLSADLSQEQLATELGITFQQIQKYEKGSNRISASTLYNMSKIMDVSIIDFFGGLDTGTQSFDFSEDELEMLNIYSKLPSNKVRSDLKSMMKSFLNSSKDSAA